ncbi:thioesterase superfamily protein [Sulfolobus islandicus Y.G.57.14]|jgi:acyl-CoA thioester hydrolase|uniref:Thioesterase superfamily protein n=9 Tax=Saccharolobus islandicus TaxID=43080 RepID=C3MJI0_SACI2|nr:thioesterase family protein [Sulfolobus islandicus]ACP34258.1 thioesterase superfamily protein [Sulfolobus islandicus L.S.2.15]ACP36997.1 thioesterase superfamily protein [Sulfolobus islandicus M.14.25]ACP44401.1 thioesterase superfamily protein [Sulfolobus islandicus Y.G.57.14]ACP54134.1 thioesterase superfamily protein [Sulfolobus islandicus M.16.27]ACR40743.1 thioesterase superfamily protein [Sulfolobus islandicus M.16.4]
MENIEYVFEDVVRIYDTDAQGIAHYAAYYRFFTNTIEKFIKEKVGIPYPIVNDDLWFVIAESHAIYRKPVKLGDRLTILLNPKILSNKTIKFDFRILRDGELTTEGYLIQIAINPKIWKSTEMPKEIMDKLSIK